MFFLKSIADIDLDSFQDLNDSPDKSSGTATEEKVRLFHFTLTKKNSALCCTYGNLAVLCGLLLGLMVLIIFDSCILGNSQLKPGDECPSYPMDCFIFPTKTNSTVVQSFQCVPKDTANFSLSYPEGHVICYGWIIGRQTTKNVLDQIGICAGLLGLFATIILLFSYIMKYPNCYVGLSVLWIVGLLVMVIVFGILGVSVVLLTYVTLALGALSVCWSCCLFCATDSYEKACCFPCRRTKVAPAPSQATTDSSVVQDV